LSVGVAVCVGEEGVYVKLESLFDFEKDVEDDETVLLIYLLLADLSERALAITARIIIILAVRGIVEENLMDFSLNQLSNN